MVSARRARPRSQHEKRLSLGPFDLGVGLADSTYDSLRRSLPVRAFGKLARRGNAPQGMHKGAEMYRAGFPAEKPVAPLIAPRTAEGRAIAELIKDYDWYHTIQLPHGVATPGYVDHRDQLAHYNLPADMTGMRVLDVATFDGFWAFEFERRGAEVVGIDIPDTHSVDVPRLWVEEFEASIPKIQKGEGFRIASEILGSKVQRETCSVYDVSPERLGMFDMVFCSDLLIHLRDPLRAMEAISTVTKRFAIFADVYSPDLDGYKNEAMVQFCWAGQGDVWWQPSVLTYNLWLRLSRFSRVEEQSRFVLESNFRRAIPKVVLHAYK